jgi:hypothetical protein
MGQTGLPPLIESRKLDTQPLGLERILPAALTPRSGLLICGWVLPDTMKTWLIKIGNQQGLELREDIGFLWEDPSDFAEQNQKFTIYNLQFLIKY